MISFFNFQFGEFTDVSPNWFDWFSICVTSLSIFAAFLIAENIYSKGKRDKKESDKNLIASENDLFENNLNELKESIGVQITHLKEYLVEKDFKLKINPALQVNFLQFIDIKCLYLNFPNNQQKKEKINSLLTSLYGMYDFKDNLISELRNYTKKHNEFQVKFKKYREIYYKKFHDYSNLRAIDIKEEAGVKKWRYNVDDKFMNEFAKLRLVSIANDENSADRKKIDENFLLPLIYLSNNFIPEDYHAIETNYISNDCHASYLDIENLNESHFKSMESYLKVLKDLKTEIEAYKK